MIVPALLFGLGWMFAGRNRPQSKIKRTPAFGTRSGQHYQVESFPEADTVIVHATDGSTMGLRKVSSLAGIEWHYQSAHGNPTTLQGIKRDFNVHMPPEPSENHPEPQKDPA